MDRVDLPIVAGDDERFLFRVGMDPMPAAVGDVSWRVQVRREQDHSASLIVELEVEDTVIVGDVYEVVVLVDAAASRAIGDAAGRCVCPWWDLQLTDEGGEVQTIVGGAVRVTQDVTV